MNLLDHESLQRLLDINSKPAVTIYMPVVMSSAPPHISENQIRYKNMIHEAVEQLNKRSDGGALAEKLEELHAKQTDQMSFWNELSPGLLLCATPESIEMFRLPIDTDEYVSVDDTFHLAPVIGLVGDQREFYVLSISQHDPKLYRGDMYGLYESVVKFPFDAAEALNLDEKKQSDNNRGLASSPSSNSNVVSGQAGASDPYEHDKMKFLRIISKIVADNIKSSTPLVLAGVEAEVAEFRALSAHPTILEGHLTGNYEAAHPDTMFKETYAVIWKELVLPAHQAAVEEYNRIHGSNPERVATDRKSIEVATEQGRVDKLLTTLSRETTDTVHDSMESVLKITFPEPAQSKSISALAAKVHQMSGKVINLMPSEMPDGAQMVARLRY